MIARLRQIYRLKEVDDLSSKQLIGLFVVLTIIPIVIIAALSLQEPKLIKGTIQNKAYQERECTVELTYDPALNISLPKEKCEGPHWTIWINNKQYQVNELLYNNLEIDSHYSFTYHPLKGLFLLNE